VMLLGPLEARPERGLPEERAERVG
jgi:hypothetical protein